MNDCYRRQLQQLSPSLRSSVDLQALTLMESTCSNQHRQWILTGQLQASILVVCRWVNIFELIIVKSYKLKLTDTIINKQCMFYRTPPGIRLYVSVKVVMLNGVRLNKYRCRQGSNSLEGLHSHLYNAIPSQRCGVMPFQVSINSFNI